MNCCFVPVLIAGAEIRDIPSGNDPGADSQPLTRTNILDVFRVHPLALYETCTKPTGLLFEKGNTVSLRDYGSLDSGDRDGALL
jgi:hypothetical protein